MLYRVHSSPRPRASDAILRMGVIVAESRRPAKEIPYPQNAAKICYNWRHENLCGQRVFRPPPLGLRGNRHRRRPRRVGRSGPGRPRQGRAGVRGGVPRLPRRQGSLSHRGHLEHDLPRGLLPRRRRDDERALGHRPGTLGHQGQGVRRAVLRADGRTLPRPHEGLLVDRRGPAAPRRRRRTRASRPSR